MDQSQTEKSLAYWRESAEYDLGVADSLFEKNKFHYALFFGHLSIEKLLKAHFVKDFHEHVPYTHSLPILASQILLKIPSDKMQKMAEFMEFYIEGRYPRDLVAVFKKFDRALTSQKMKEIKEIYQWLNEKL